MVDIVDQDSNLAVECGAMLEKKKKKKKKKTRPTTLVLRYQSFVLEVLQMALLLFLLYQSLEVSHLCQQ